MENGDRWSLHELSRRLETAPPEIRARYEKLLLDKQIKGAKENEGRPIVISPEERLEILDRAKLPTTEEFYPGIDFKGSKKGYGPGGTHASHIHDALPENKP